MSRLRANQITNENANGAPNFPHGLTVTGIVTATTSATTMSQIVVGSAVTANSQGIDVTGIVTATSYRGDGSQLTGIDASSLKNGSDVKVQANASGAVVTGILTATQLRSTNPGVIEEISGLCDGSTRSCNFGTFTFPNVTGIQDIDTTTYTDFNATIVTYKPPAGAIGVHVEYRWVMSHEHSSHAIQHYKLYINGSADGLSGNTEVTEGRLTIGGDNVDLFQTYSHYFRIQPGLGSFNTATGTMSGWSENKTIKLMSRSYQASGHTIPRHHASQYWNGSSGHQFHRPTIIIKAYG